MALFLFTFLYCFLYYLKRGGIANGIEELGENDKQCDKGKDI